MRKIFDTYLFPIFCAFLPLLAIAVDPFDIIPLPDRLEPAGLLLGAVLIIPLAIVMFSLRKGLMISIGLLGVFIATSIIFFMVTTWFARWRDINEGESSNHLLLDAIHVVTYDAFYVSAALSVLAALRIASLLMGDSAPPPDQRPETTRP